MIAPKVVKSDTPSVFLADLLRSRMNCFFVCHIEYDEFKRSRQATCLEILHCSLALFS